jgi:hypothetical protein
MAESERESCGVSSGLRRRNSSAWGLPRLGRKRGNGGEEVGNKRGSSRESFGLYRCGGGVEFVRQIMGTSSSEVRGDPDRGSHLSGGRKKKREKERGKGVCG